MTKRFTQDEYKELFNKFDNGNGILSLAEVDRAVNQWYPEYGRNHQATVRAFKEADVNKSGFVEVREFSHLMELLYHYNQFCDLFGQLDTNKDKKIGFNEFVKGHELIGQTNLDENHLKEEFDRIDTDHSGQISFDEFCIQMAKKNSS